MNRFAMPLVSLVLVAAIADAKAEEPYQTWLKSFEGDWQQSLMGKTTVYHHKPAAGGHAVLMQSADGAEIGLIGWQADSKTMVHNIYAANGSFVESEATEVGERTMRGTRVARPGPGAPVFKGTDEWRWIGEDRFEIAFNGHMGQAEVAGTMEFTRPTKEGPETANRKPVLAATIAEAELPCRQWLKFLEGDWEAAFGDGRTTVFHEKLVAGGRALLNQPDDGVVLLTGWRPDTNVLVQTLYAPGGGHQRSEMTEIGEDTMSGTFRGWFAPLGVAYKGKSVWRRIDDNTYEINMDADIGGVKYKTTHKITRKTKED